MLGTVSVFKGACARENIVGTIATICKTTHSRKHVFLSSAALARPCTKPCRPCWQRRSPSLCSDDRRAGASTVTSVCWKTLARRPSTANVATLHGSLPAYLAARYRSLLARCMKHTPSRVAEPRCNASRSLRGRSETHSSGILPSTA